MASNSHASNGLNTSPFSYGSKGYKRTSSESMSSYGSPITFTARTESTNTIEDADKKTLDYNENSGDHCDPSRQLKGLRNRVQNSENNAEIASGLTEPTSMIEHSGESVPPQDKSHLEASGGSEFPRTSTPQKADNHRPDTLTTAGLSTQPAAEDAEDELNASFSSNVSVQSTQSQTDSDILNSRVQVPILGYEVMEERARFTIYKIAVHKGTLEKWFIFRRYNDFVHLNEQLRELFPHFRLALPPKKWFGDNFDRDFIEDRMLGLQAFLNNIVGHRDVCSSEPVKEFFCFEDPPGPHDSLEESKAMCEILEEELYNMKRNLREKEAQVTLLKEELSLKNAEIDNLRKSLRIERALNSSRLKERVSPSSQSQKSESSLPEALMETDQATASSSLTSPSSKNEESTEVTKGTDNFKLGTHKGATKVSPSGGVETATKAPSSGKDSRATMRKDSMGKAVIKSSRTQAMAS